MTVDYNEENRVNWIIINTTLNGLGHTTYKLTEDNSLPDYNYWEEALLWAKSKDYFPNLSENVLFSILRKYECWNEFEKYCEEEGYKNSMKG